jgi:hypothetical protein
MHDKIRVTSTTPSNALAGRRCHRNACCACSEARGLGDTRNTATVLPGFSLEPTSGHRRLHSLGVDRAVKTMVSKSRVIVPVRARVSSQYGGV